MTDSAATSLLEIKLDPNDVAGPAQRIATTAASVVIASMEALLENAYNVPDLSGPSGMGYIFPKIEDLDARKIIYENWLLEKGFNDLARGIRESLEAAYLYIAIINLKFPMQYSDLEMRANAFRQDAQKLPFPILYQKVNERLTTSMQFEDEFHSLQAVRNCLEHRSGIVSKKDTNGASELILAIPRMKAFYFKNGEEKEIFPGNVIDTQENNIGTRIYVRLEKRSKSFELGKRIIFSANEFNEIAMACFIFAGDLAAKLPAIKAPAIV